MGRVTLRPRHLGLLPWVVGSRVSPAHHKDEDDEDEEDEEDEED